MTNPELTNMLQTCSLHELEMILQMTLSREGFGDIEIMNRRLAKQKSRFGGYDLVCRRTIGSVQETIIVKIVRDTVRIRHCSELMGEIDRANADLGLLVTPFHVCDSAVTQLTKYTKSRFEVLDGNDLADLLTKYEIGVRGRGEIDYAYFTGLREASERIIGFINKLRHEAR